MAVFIYEPDAYEKMSNVELHDDLWLRQMAEGSFGRRSFQAFLDEWKANWQVSIHSPATLAYTRLTVDGNGAIYGRGGYNRYIVRGSGEIWFLRDQAMSKADTERAREQGFRLFPDDEED